MKEHMKRYLLIFRDHKHSSHEVESLYVYDSSKIAALKSVSLDTRFKNKEILKLMYDP